MDFSKPFPKPYKLQFAKKHVGYDVIYDDNPIFVIPIHLGPEYANSIVAALNGAYLEGYIQREEKQENYMNKLVKNIKAKSNITTTENGAKTYRSTKSAVLDFFYLAPTRQGQDNTDLFTAAYSENPELAIKAAFYLRDIRAGKGQRNSFRDILKYMAKEHQYVFNQMVPYVPEYGRWDDLIEFYDIRSVRNFVEDQFHMDLSK